MKEIVFDEVYEENVDKVYRTAVHFTRNHYAAEEITQTVFMKLYMNLENVNMDAVRSWLLTTTKHMAMNYKRDFKREVLLDEFQDTDVEFASESLEDGFMEALRENEYKDLVEEIFADLYQLNPSWYDAVTITYCLQKPQKEVAENMGISLEALQSMLYRAKKWIRKRYEEQFRHLEGK